MNNFCVEEQLHYCDDTISAEPDDAIEQISAADTYPHILRLIDSSTKLGSCYEGRVKALASTGRDDIRPLYALAYARGTLIYAFLVARVSLDKSSNNRDQHLPVLAGKPDKSARRIATSNPGYVRA
eukprot:scaffold14812_cov18-Prasinocladus_malaysianus.AAC.1